MRKDTGQRRGWMRKAEQTMRGGKEGAREHKIFLEIIAGKGP